MSTVHPVRGSRSRQDRGALDETDGLNRQAGRLGASRRMGGVSGQEPGGLNRPSRDVESMERRLQHLLELYPELEGTSLSEYVEALSKKSTSEVK